MLYFVWKYITFKKTYITKTCQKQTLPVFLVTGRRTPKNHKKKHNIIFCLEIHNIKKTYIIYTYQKHTLPAGIWLSTTIIIKKYEVTNFLTFYNRYTKNCCQTNII